MKDLVGARLPNFTSEEKVLMNGSYDYFGLNHYTSSYTENRTVESSAIGWEYDHHVQSSRDRDGILIGPRADSTWLYVVPWGIRKSLQYIKETYGNPQIFITENGVSVPDESLLPLQQALNDSFRINYYGGYLSQVSKSISEDQVNVKGFFAWSLLDNFEWADGYSKRFGIIYVDYSNNLTRHKKRSSVWYSQVIQSNIPQQENDDYLIAFAVVPALVLIVIVVYLLVRERMGYTKVPSGWV